MIEDRFPFEGIGVSDDWAAKMAIAAEKYASKVIMEAGTSSLSRESIVDATKYCARCLRPGKDDVLIGMVLRAIPVVERKRESMAECDSELLEIAREEGNKNYDLLFSFDCAALKEETNA